MVWTPIWERKAPDDNAYAHPVAGLHAVVDLDTGEVIEVEDHGVAPGAAGAGALPRSRSSVRRGPCASWRSRRPDGPGFTVDGWQVRWQKWSLRVGFCPREGLVIHDVRYDDDGSERRIAHRMSIAELVIPYGDPSPGSYRKNAFDTGEVGMGYFTNSLELGCDCLGEIRYLDVSVADADGTVRTIPNGICLHEEDDGMLWKHTDPDGHVEVRRSRRFVVSSFVTVDNYEYGYFWYFGQDGAIEFEAKLTGIVLTLAGDAGRGAAVRAPRSRPGWSRRTTSTSSARGSTSTSTARRTPWSRSTRCAPPDGAGQPVRRRVRRAGDAARRTSRPRSGWSTRCAAATGRS